MKKTDFSPRTGLTRRDAIRRAAGAGALASLSSLAGFGVTSAEAAEEALGKFPKHPQWKFVFVNHVTTNPFWVPLRYGAEDACALLVTTFQWTGSEKSIATEMVNAFNTAVSAKADGIAVSLVDPSAFNEPVEKALAADAGSTEGVGKTMAANKLHEKGIHAGGFDLLPTTLDAISKGDLDFTIDQQPYLQGFYTIMVLFVYKISGGLSGLSDINTGLKFVTKANVGPYLSTQSRFEGSSNEEKILTRAGAIS